MFDWILNTPLLMHLLMWKLSPIQFHSQSTYHVSLAKSFHFSTSLCSMKLKVGLCISLNKWNRFVTSPVCSFGYSWKQFYYQSITHQSRDRGDDFIYNLLLSKAIIYHTWEWRVGVNRLPTNKVYKIALSNG